MATTVQQPYNLFATPKLTKPVQAYDPTKSVEDNMAGKGNPSAQNIIAAQNTPQAQLQQAQSQNQTQNQQPKHQFNGDPNSSTAGMDYLNSLYTSPQEEERLRKASVMNQRILAIGDAIRHIGNIANTVNYAPAQQFNSPVAEEQARYEKGKALRDRANQQFYTYQQQKAAQDAAQRKWEQQFQYNQAKDAANLQAMKDYRAATIAEQQRYHDLVNALNTRKADDAKANNEKNIAIRQQNADANTLRASRYGTGKSGGSRGGAMAEYDVTSTRTKRENSDGSVTWEEKKSRRNKYGSEKSSKTTTNAYGGTRHGSGGNGSKGNRFGVKPAK